jgi:transcriptional regulator with XRE-family HTH domain
VTSSVHQAREALGQRLRDVRKDAQLTGRQLAELAGWHSSKVSFVELDRQAVHGQAAREIVAASLRRFAEDSSNEPDAPDRG